MVRYSARRAFCARRHVRPNVIYIEAGEYPDRSVEKFPIRYDIDTLRCIYCGYCVEACPCDAVRMDSGTHPGNLGFGRKEFVETKEVLMKRSEDLAEKGKEGLYEEYVKPYRHVYHVFR